MLTHGTLNIFGNTRTEDTLKALAGMGAGRAYYVNNISGDSGNDGLSWNSAMDELSTAITASETYRALPSGGTNDYIQNTIIVQATGTAYSAVSALPNYCNIIGLGATTRGNGPGIVRIDGGGSADAMASSGVRGLGLYNLQAFQSSAGSFYGLDLAVCFRSTIEDCSFVNNGSGGIRVEQGGSIVMNNVHCGSDTLDSDYGLEVGGGSNFNACKITNSDFHGYISGVLLGDLSMRQTLFIDCVAHGRLYGFKDTQADGQAANFAAASYIRCYGYGRASNSINDGGFKISYEYNLKAIGCISNSDGSVFAYPTAST